MSEVAEQTEGAHQDIGVVDEPLAKGGQDQLQIRKHASALAKFVKRSQTPITIGIQGEWGSGKTSLLNTIYRELELANDHLDSKDFKMIWINSWENALMSAPEEALIKIINEIINELMASDSNVKNTEKVKEVASTAFKGLLRVGAQMAGGAQGGQVMKEILDSKNSIRDLRDTMAGLVEEIRNSENQRIDKVVVFVDDLDRIDPPEAVKILELLKNIFSIPGCVFILAIDYQVVIKGLKEKFGERTPENEWEFRAFFDKIIQLPFLMPMGSYNIGNYVNDLLIQIGFQDDNQIDNEFIENVVNSTIGGNPRSIKRLINSLALITIFNQEEGDDNESEEGADRGDLDPEIEKQLVFSLVCLQIASSDVYSLLSQQPNFKEWDDTIAFSFTQKKEEQDEQFLQNFDAVKEQEYFNDPWEQALYRICYANPRERAKATDLSKFFNYLDESIGAKSDISSAITFALGQTAVTSVVSTDDVARAPKGSYQRNYATGFDGWQEEIAFRNSGTKPQPKFVELMRAIVEMWKAKFGAVEWSKGDKLEVDIRFSGGAVLYFNGKKVGHLKHHNVGKNSEYAQVRILKNPERDNRLVSINGLDFNHVRKYRIDRETKEAKGDGTFNEFQDIDISDPSGINIEDLEFLYAESLEVRRKYGSKLMNGKEIDKYVKDFKNKRQDSSAWAEAADFLESYYDENNRVVIQRD